MRIKKISSHTQNILIDCHSNLLSPSFSLSRLLFFFIQCEFPFGWKNSIEQVYNNGDKPYNESNTVANAQDVMIFGSYNL